MKKILVTGATGFIGSHLVPKLLEDGFEVSVLVRKSSAPQKFPWHGAVKVLQAGCVFTEIDEAVRAANPDVVVHLASRFLVSHSSEDVDDIVGSNVLFGALLVEAMTKRGKDRLVHASTYWTHYEGKAYRPVNLYAASKKAFVDMLEFYCDANDLKALNLEFYDTFGVGDKRRKIVNILLEHIGNPAPLAMSPGDQEMDIVHIDDVVAALLHAVKLISGETTAGMKTYQIRTGKPHSLKAIVGLIEKTGGEKLNVVFGGRPYRPREVMEPYAGGETLPGWRAKISLSDGIKSILESGAGKRPDSKKK